MRVLRESLPPSVLASDKLLAISARREAASPPPWNSNLSYFTLHDDGRITGSTSWCTARRSSLPVAAATPSS